MINEKEKNMYIQDLNNCTKKYDFIYTDPAWKQTKGNKRKCRPNQGKELDYKTIGMEEIKEIHRQASKLCNEKHNIFMWTIDKYLHETEKMMKELGYELHARFIWDKENGVAPAFTVRFAHEYLLWFYKKGNILMPCQETRGKYTTVLREASTKHSKKPICAYEMMENMFPNSNKLELFSRQERTGWDCWGNEVNLLAIDNLD
jgi:N6-adenosine-specific RNA methylase IME4